MNTRGDTDKQRPPSRPNPRPWQGPAFLALGAGALAAAVLLCVLDQTIDHDFSRGVYSILTGLFVVGLVGWVSIFNEERTRREAAWEVRTVLARMEELASRVEELSDEVAKWQLLRPPSGSATAQRGAAVNAEELREEVERVVIEELGTRESVRSQGYAEGYVDGIDRRNDEDPPAN